MTEGPGAEGTPPTFTDNERAPGQDWLSDLGEQERRELLAWVGEHLPRVRRSVYGQRLLYQSLGFGFVVGLAAHVGGGGRVERLARVGRQRGADPLGAPAWFSSTQSRAKRPDWMSSSTRFISALVSSVTIRGPRV